MFKKNEEKIVYTKDIQRNYILLYIKLAILSLKKEESMQQRHFIITVIMVNVAFVLLQIDKRIRSTKLMYNKQTLEHELVQLQKKHDQLNQELCNLQQHDTIKRYAARYLHMCPVTIRQLKKIVDHV